MQISMPLSFLLKVFLFLVTHFSLFSSNLSFDLESENVMCINGKTGAVLFEKNADRQIYPASVTKVASGLYSLVKKKGDYRENIAAKKEALKLVHCLEKRRDNFSRYPEYVLENDGVSIHIVEGEVFTYDELIHSSLIMSANDASNVLAQYHGNGSIEAFMQELNSFLQKLGCKNTHFCNPHGLHHPNHYTTARDLATIAKYATVHPAFSEIVKKTSYEVKPTNKSPKRTFKQKNRLLVKGQYYYPYACGMKTGHTQKAKWNLIASAEKDGRLVICVLMNSEDRFGVYRDAKKIFDTVFSEKIVEKEIVPKGHMVFQRTFSTSYEVLKTYTKSPFVLSFYPSEEPNLRCTLTWEDLSPPIAQGVKVATLSIFRENTLLGTQDLFSENAVQNDFFLSLKESVSNISFKTALFILLGAFVVVGLILIIIRK